MSEGRRVVITGLGSITPIGLNNLEYSKALRAGVSGGGLITRFDTRDFDVKIACELKGFDPLNHMDKRLAIRTDPVTQYAIPAAREALFDAGLINSYNDQGLKEIINRQRVGVILGTGIGGIETIIEQTGVLIERGPGRVSPFTIPMLMPNAGAATIARIYNIQGGCESVNSACSSSNSAIAIAYDKIILGKVDVVISGGAEAPIDKLAVSAFENMHALTKKFNDNPSEASRPFDKDRSGFVLGEGAGIVVLENLEHAQKRGARIYVELLGYGETNDAHDIVAPHPEGGGAAQAMKAAINDSGITTKDVNYINAHGTSTESGDRAETRAIKAVFGEQKPLVSSTKSMTGHLAGAAGVIELIAIVLGMKESFVPPNINYKTPDPECDLNFVPNTSLERRIDVALSNSFGFGGHNVVLAVRRWEN